MKRKLAFTFAVIGLAVASAKSYTISLYEAVMLGQTQIKAGEYDVKLVDQKAVVTKLGFRSEAAVTVENNDRKFERTSVVISDEGGNRHIHEIRLGGTTTKLVLNH